MEGDTDIRWRLAKFLAPLAAQRSHDWIWCPDHDDHDDLRSWCRVESMPRPLCCETASLISYTDTS